MVALSIGKTTYDITVPLEEYPVENGKYVLNEKLEGSGGCASNVAYLLGKWNYDSYFAGTIGYDDIGTSIKKELENGHVHTNFLEVNYEKKTTTTFILANKQTTSRTQLMIEPEKYHLKKYDFDISPNVIYSDGYEYSATQAAMNQYPGVTTILGAGLNHADEKEIIALIKYAKYVVFSLEFACRVTKMQIDMNNPNTLLNLYMTLQEKYPNNIIIVTLHNFGALYSINNEIKVMPTMNVKEVDRTGAGDIFDGALAYSLGKGYDLEKAIRLANIAAALSTTKYGAKNSIPLLSDVLHEYESKFGPVEPTETQTVEQAPQSQPTETPSSTPNQATPPQEVTPQP